ncbi:hypothetical protein TNCV_1846051 [Trichonephila clavipes]|nr:hypothetical protein TNCV_1846051 [Trichonephila clavipes]
MLDVPLHHHADVTMFERVNRDIVILEHRMFSLKERLIGEDELRGCFDNGDHPLKTTKCFNPWKDISPHTVAEPPSCLTIETKQSTLITFTYVHRTNTRLVVWSKVNKDSSDQMTDSLCSFVQLR